MKEKKSFFIDTSKCIACRGCQIACKAWNQLPAEKTINRGSLQNPEDLSYITWKLVRFNEVPEQNLAWHFFQDQCRHCLKAPCKEVADKIVKGAITQDEKTGAIIFNPKTKIKPADFKEIREACPYDIPRFHAETGTMAFCNMCANRMHAGLLPACVKTCSTKAMNFGDRAAVLKMAEKRLSEAKEMYKEAVLTDPDDVRVIYLLVDHPVKYHKFAVAEKKIEVKS
jgi:formate dehydrogenase iron-sulfur subunit